MDRAAGAGGAGGGWADTGARGRGGLRTGRYLTVMYTRCPAQDQSRYCCTKSPKARPYARRVPLVPFQLWLVSQMSKKSVCGCFCF